MKLLVKIFSITLILLVMSCTSTPSENPPTVTVQPTIKVNFLPTITALPPTRQSKSRVIPLPPQGYLYHGVFPGGKTGEEDDLTLKDLSSYEQAVGKTVAWVYFSNNWYRSREFPTGTATWIRDAGSIPYIRLMLRSELKHENVESTFSLQNIIDGKFDADLHTWCVQASDFGTPLLVEYGTEVNSDSFAWSGIWNGGGRTNDYGDPTQPDGPERFKDAYRHIIQICRDEKANNITWVFHVDGEDSPNLNWNQLENYYPGDEWIDWIGISIYSSYTPQNDYWDIFHDIMGLIYYRLIKLAPTKPIIVAEFGAPKGNPHGDQAQWANWALSELTSSWYPKVIGFSWWNEWWPNDRNPAHDTTMRVQDNPDLAAVFQELVGNNPKILGEIPQ